MSISEPKLTFTGWMDVIISFRQSKWHGFYGKDLLSEGVVFKRSLANDEVQSVVLWDGPDRLQNMCVRRS